MEFPYGLCVLEDPETTDSPPDFATPDALVAVSASAVAVAVRHGQEGDATVRLFVGEEFTAPGALVFDGVVTCESGNLRLTDVEGRQRSTAAVAAGVHRLRVFADDDREPTEVNLLLD